MIDQNRGFILVSLLWLMPLLLLLTTTLVALVYVVRARTSAEAQCRQTLFQTQKDLGILLENLLRLNPRARQLQTLRRAAEVQVKAALISANPAWLAEAQAFRSQVILTQTQLRLEQQRILAQAQFRRAKVNSDFQLATKWAPIFRSRREEGHLALAVRPEPLDDLSPTYKILEPFAKLQGIRLHFQTRLFGKAPSFINNFYETKNDQFKSQCFVTLHQEGRKWTPTLNGAKFTLN